jgi:outer membrane protein TolC
MKRILIPLLAMLASLPLPADVIRMRDLPALVLGKDLTVDSATQTAIAAYQTYRGTVAQSFPQIDLTTNYSLDYLPVQESLSYALVGPGIAIADVKSYDQASHMVGAKVSLSQLLPTAGTLSLAVSHQMSASAFSSQDSTIGATTNKTAGTSQFAQKPVISLSLTQPLFVNGKLIDLGLFPATIKKAEVGYQKADAGRLHQTNQAIAQAAQLLLSAVQLRKNLSQAEKAIAVSQGNLDTMKQNYLLGLAAEADLLDSQIALSNQQQAALSLRSSLRKTEMSLAHSIGREDLSGVVLDEEVPAVEVKMEREALVRAAQEHHPLIRQQMLTAEERRVDDIISGQRYASTLSLSLSYTPKYPFSLTNNPYYNSDLGKSFTDLYGSGSSSDITVSAGLTVHLFDGGQQYAARAGNAAITRSAENSLAAQRQAIRDQVDQDFLMKGSLEDKIAMLSAAVDLARKRVDTEQALLGLGRSTELAVAARQSDFESKQNDLWRSRADLFTTMLDLSYLAGEDLSKTIEGTPE